MRDEINIPDHFPLLKEEDLKEADRRREDYSRLRDSQAEEDNRAIAARLEKEKEIEKEKERQS